MHNSHFCHNTDIGQNFLTSRDIARQMVEESLSGDDWSVLEIGPGKGILTEALIDSPYVRVDAVELDRRLEPWLTPIFQHPKANLHWGDAMRLDLPLILPKAPEAIVANLPYNITTPIIMKFLEELVPLGTSKMVFMVQRESAMRMISPPGCKERSPLGITLSAMGTVKKMRNVARGSFTPVPRVDSAIVVITTERNRELGRCQKWKRLLKASFASRRKTLANNLAAAFSGTAQHFYSVAQSCGIGKNARAEELTLEQWNSLYSLDLQE